MPGLDVIRFILQLLRFRESVDRRAVVRKDLKLTAAAQSEAARARRDVLLERDLREAEEAAKRKSR